MVLPLLGGSPAVWTTRMLFFQGSLVAGYAYAHLSIELLGVRRQAVVHAVFMLLPLFFLPLEVWEKWRPPTHGNPAGWLLLLLTVAVGLPFFVVASTSPLLQRWFGATGLPAARDPYHLYAASNGGSMLALLAYPVLLEPTLALRDQSWVWSGACALLTALVWACAIAVCRSAAAPVEPHGPGRAGGATASDLPLLSARVSGRRRLRWIALAFSPTRARFRTLDGRLLQRPERLRIVRVSVTTRRALLVWRRPPGSGINTTGIAGSRRSCGVAR